MAAFWAFTGSAEPLAVFEGEIAGQALAGIYLKLVTIGGDAAGYMLKVIFILGLPPLLLY
jgi:hypothetical protein